MLGSVTADPVLLRINITRPVSHFNPKQGPGAAQPSCVIVQRVHGLGTAMGVSKSVDC